MRGEGMWAVISMALACVLILGCGSSRRASEPVATRGGSIQVSITWPARGRLVPVRAESIRLVHHMLREKDGSWLQLGEGKLVTRPPAGQERTTVTLDRLPYGMVKVVATAYPDVGGTGVAQATGSTQVEVVEAEAAKASLSMASTVVGLEISPASLSLSEGETAQLRVRAKDNDGATVLLSPDRVEWKSSDEARVAVDAHGVIDEEGIGAAVKGLRGGEAAIQVVATDAESGKCISAEVSVGDGGLIAFAAQDRIWVVGADGTGARNLGIGRCPSWSGDGRMIACEVWTGQQATQSASIWVISTDDGRAHQVTSGPRDFQPAMSPDGERIAFSRDGGIWVASLDGSLGQLPIDGLLQGGDPDHRQYFGPRWSPDGTLIACNAVLARSSKVTIIPAAGGNSRDLTDDSLYAAMPEWSPDGSHITFSAVTQSYPVGRYVSGIYMIPSEGGVVRPLLIEDYCKIWHARPCWAPDGSRIAFSYLGWVYVMEPLSGEAAALIEGEYPSWGRAPDAEE